MHVVPLWRKIQKNNFTHVNALLDFLEMEESLRKVVCSASSFPLNLPKRLAAKISKNTLEDPLLKQFIPLKEEEVSTPGFILDPLQEGCFRKEKKLLQKYQGRTLLLLTSACAMHCRYCFRRHFDYDRQDMLFEKELEEIAQNSTLSEILFSGGDPLSLSDEALQRLLSRCDAIPHIKRIRFHTRFPLGIPERITDDLLKIFASTRSQIIFIIHSNHAKEWDGEIFHALQALQKLGIPLLQQGILLKGINDSLDPLLELYELLIDHGILPYYLYQLDKVQGAAHFEVEEEIGKSLIRALAKKLPGYGVPKYVKEVPGEAQKTPLFG